MWEIDKLFVCTREHHIQTHVEHVSAYCIGLTPDPLSKGPVGGAPCSTSVPLGKDAGAWPHASARPLSKVRGKPFS